ncbi:MAG: PDZ domain-containing protein, partial [Deltaproteobacteria bacterium]|nr:PDZ domain-containing protein [Deltaproteobacteria bacterium]
ETTAIDLVVESQDGRITGQVVDEGGGPVADAFVEAVRESDSAAATKSNGRSRARWGAWARQPVLTDEDGRFELENLAEDSVYSVYANRKGGGEAIAEGVASGSDVQLSVEQVGVLAGVVKLAGGGFPERFKISVADRKEGIRRSDKFMRTDGQWRISNLPAGNFEVMVDSSEGNAKVEVELPEGGEQTDVELTLTPRVNVRGKLVDAETGAPVPGLKVSINADGGSFSFGGNDTKPGQEDISDTEGNFVVKDAGTGKVRIMIMAPSFTDDDYGWHWMNKRLPAKPTEQDLGTIELIKKRIDRGEEKGDLGFKGKDQEPGTEPEDVRHVVAFVRPNSPAAKAGLEPGDEIVKVDGQDVTGTNAYRYGKLLNVLPGRKVSLTLAAGAKVDITAGPPV